MTETWEAICLVAAAAIYSSLLLTALYPAVSKTLVAIFARLKKRHVEDILLVVFVCSAICAGGSKGTNGNNRASATRAGESRLAETGDRLRDAGDGDLGEGIRFSFFAVDTNAVHYEAFWSPLLELPGGKIDLFAAHDLTTNYWEFIGDYNIAAAETNIVDSVPLAMFPFAARDQLFLILGTRVDLDGDGLYDIREKLMIGTSPDLADTDGDGLLDGDELASVPALDPLAADMDEDGYLDGEEVLAGTAPGIYDSGASTTIRYYYDGDDRLIGAYSGELDASSSISFTPVGNPERQVSQ